MAHGSPPPGGIIAGINVTPLVDITLVLLIIFIVTAKIVVTPAVRLDLPQAASGEEVQVVLSLIVPARGPVLVDGEPALDDSQLHARASAAARAHRDLRAVILADGDTRHSRIMHVLDQLKLAGIAHVAFGVSPTSPASATGSANAPEGT